MLAVIGALEGELSAVVTALDGAREETVAGRRCVFGTIGGAEVLVACSGVGKTLAAMTSQAVVDRFGPTAIVCAGLGGALSAEYHIGDAVLAGDCMQYDVDARAFGFARGEIPHSGMRVFAADSRLLAKAKRVVPADARRLHTGRVLTGDRFVAAADTELARILRDELGGDVVDMESAAVALVAAVHRIPFLSLRTVSDKVEEDIRGRFSRVLAASGENTLRLVRTLNE